MSGITVLMADCLSPVYSEVGPPWILLVYTYTMNACGIWNLANPVEGLHALTHGGPDMGSCWASLQ